MTKAEFIVAHGDICDQSYRSGRVNVNQLQHLGINLALLKEERWHPQCVFHVSVPVETNFCIQPIGGLGESTQEARALHKQATKSRLQFDIECNHGESFKFWMTYNCSVSKRLGAEKDLAHLTDSLS